MRFHRTIGISPFLFASLFLPIACRAQGQNVKGRIYPEKQTYLAGEPVFVVLDLANEGPLPAFVDVGCEWLDARFEAPTAPKPRGEVSLFGCEAAGWGGDCASNPSEILPGGHFRLRYLLDGNFRLDRPGSYPVQGRYKVDVFEGETGFKPVASKEVVSNFEVTLVEGDEKSLMAAYQPLLRDLHPSGTRASWLALNAILQNPPRFLENTILQLADDPNTVGTAIQGLERLATPRAEAKLAELSGPENPEGTRQQAIQTLGRLGDPAYCPLMLDIAQHSREYSRFIALRAAGYLCGRKVIPLARSFLSSQDYSTRFEAAYALGNSGSRDAVQLLIPLLRDPNPEVRRAASGALATLTHRKLKDLPSSEATATRAYQEWMNWWSLNAASAAIYTINQCAEPAPLQ